jgi:hypothetical protein
MNDMFVRALLLVGFLALCVVLFVFAGYPVMHQNLSGKDDNLITLGGAFIAYASVAACCVVGDPRRRWMWACILAGPLLFLALSYIIIVPERSAVILGTLSFPLLGIWTGRGAARWITQQRHSNEKKRVMR